MEEGWDHNISQLWDRVHAKAAKREAWLVKLDMLLTPLCKAGSSKEKNTLFMLIMCFCL